MFDRVDRIDYGASWITIDEGSSPVLFVALPSGDVRSLVLPGEDDDSGWSSVGLSPDETELWAVESDPPTLHRFALPR